MAARHGKGVDNFCVNNLKVVSDVFPFGMLSKPLAEIGDVRRNNGLVINFDFLLDLLGELLPEFHFLFIGKDVNIA